MIDFSRFFKHKRFEKEYKEAVEECEALKLENKELYRILADLKEERKLKDKYKHECEQKHEIIEELKEQLQANQPTGICETCMATALLQNDRYRKALEEIEKVINNIFSSCLGRETKGCTPVHNVCEELIKMLNIIGKAKEYKSD